VDNQLPAGTGTVYDGNGNPTPTYASQDYTFDQLNRLTAATKGLSGEPSITMGYDGDSLRAWKSDAGGATTYYLNDDDGSPIMELNASGAVQAMNGYGPTGWAARDYPGSGALAATYENRRLKRSHYQASRMIPLPG
jgi:hypothetical protein